MARQTSTPLIPGIMRSVITRVGRPLAKDRQSLFGIVGSAHIEALCGEGGAQHARNLRLIVDHQNSSRHLVLLSFRGRLHHQSAPGIIPSETTMQVNSTFGTATRWLGATLAAVLHHGCTGLVGAGFHTAGLVFLVVVVWTATQAAMAVSLYSAIFALSRSIISFCLRIHTFHTGWGAGMGRDAFVSGELGWLRVA